MESISTILIAYYGAVLSTIVAAWTIWLDIFKTRSRVKIELSYCKYNSSLCDDNIRTAVVFKVTNVGHVAVFVECIECKMHITNAYEQQIPGGNFETMKKEKYAYWALRAAALYDHENRQEMFPRELKAGETFEGQINHLRFLELSPEYQIKDLWVRNSRGRRFHPKKKNLERMKMWYKRNPDLSTDLSVKAVNWY